MRKGIGAVLWAGERDMEEEVQQDASAEEET